MKIFAFVDMHGNKSAFNNILTKAGKKDIELVVCAGDFTIFGDHQDIFLSKINKLGKPILIIHGNHEDESDLRKSCSLFKNIHFIHKNGFRKGNYLFFGAGGGGFSLRDREFEKYSKKFNKFIKKDDNVILVSHAPPYNTKMDKIAKEHAGNKSIRNFIAQTKPMLNICGHLHECVGIDMIGKTVVVNPGYKGRKIII